MNRKSEPQTLPPMQVLPVTPGVPSLVAPLSTREEALLQALTETREQLRGQLREEHAASNDALCTVLKYYGLQGAGRTARARRAGSAPKQKIASEHAEWVEVWLAEAEYRLQFGIRPRKGHLDKIVADRFGKDPLTIKRARLEAGYS